MIFNKSQMFKFDTTEYKEESSGGDQSKSTKGTNDNEEKSSIDIFALDDLDIPEGMKGEVFE